MFKTKTEILLPRSLAKLRPWLNEAEYLEFQDLSLKITTLASTLPLSVKYSFWFWFLNILLYFVYGLPSVLWQCWLGDRKGIRPVKNWVVGCWHGCLSGARCRLASGPTDATATHCHSPGIRAIKRVHVVLCMVCSRGVHATMSGCHEANDSQCWRTLTVQLLSSMLSIRLV